MHAILHLQTNWTVAENNQTLKQRLGEASTGSFLVHDDGTELLVITHEHDLLTAEDERYHALCKRIKAVMTFHRIVTTYLVQRPALLRQLGPS